MVPRLRRLAAQSRGKTPIQAQPVPGHLGSRQIQPRWRPELHGENWHQGCSRDATPAFGKRKKSVKVASGPVSSTRG